MLWTFFMFFLGVPSFGTFRYTKQFVLNSVGHFVTSPRHAKKRGRGLSTAFPHAKPK